MKKSKNHIQYNGKRYERGDELVVQLSKGKKDRNQLVSHEDTGRVILLDGAGTVDFTMCAGAVIRVIVYRIGDTYSVVRPIEPVQYPDMDNIVREGIPDSSGAVTTD